jgi:hypothetical protein
VTAFWKYVKEIVQTSHESSNSVTLKNILIRRKKACVKEKNSSCVSKLRFSYLKLNIHVLQINVHGHRKKFIYSKE